MTPQAVLWEMDGTLIDTEPWFIDAVDNLIHAGGGYLDPDDHHTLAGLSLPDTADLAIRAGVRMAQDDIIDAITLSGGAMLGSRGRS